jgi:hypothetical protein
MQGELGIIDSGILQFAPKGAYYEGKDEQYNAVKKMWADLFDYDRTLFTLLMLLKGTGFSKGAMSHILLSNPPQLTYGTDKYDSRLPAELDGLPAEFEKEVMAYALFKEKTPRALKNLLMLTGTEGHTRVNNSRTRKLILGYIFDRDDKSLDYLAVNYKNKLQTLVRHALGKQDVTRVLIGNKKYFRKLIGRYNNNAYPVLCHLFNRTIPGEGPYFPLIEKYYHLRYAAQSGDVVKFKEVMKDLPIRTVMGMRNLYKIKVNKSEVLQKTKMSVKDTIQMQAAVKKAGVKRDVNYDKQDIYDLFIFLYFKIDNDDETDIDKILTAIDNAEKKLPKIDIGECAVIMDASHSMKGSDQRPMHPFLTGMSIIATLDNVKDVIYVGGKEVPLSSGESTAVVPANSTDLWRGLVTAALSGAKNIVLISDGYENTIKGMFKNVYDHLKKSGYDFKLTHINPVFSASSSNGTARKLTDDTRPLPVGDYKFLETEVIFSKLIEDREMVKKLLIAKYRNLLT